MRKLTVICMMIGVCIQYAYAQKMTVKNNLNYVLMEVNDEGVMGSITLPDTNTALTVYENKLYNLNGTLMWDGTALGSAASSGGWTDDGTVVRLTTITDKVGIGIASPAYPLDVDSTIGLTSMKVLYLPKQSHFGGSLFLGNGGSNLSNSVAHGGKWNTGLGIGALSANTTGSYNTASGYYALYSNTTGGHNTAIGHKALHYNSSNSNNTAVGSFSLYNNTGSGNTAVGQAALSSNTTGLYNVALGSGALTSNVGGFGNVGLGMLTNYFNETGSENIVIGCEAGRGGTSAHNKSGNVIIGYQAGYNAGQDASYNVLVGYKAGYNETGANKLYIENTDSNTPLIGGDFSADEIYLNGDVGIGRTSPGAALDVNGKIMTTQLQVGTSTTAGYVLTADASGNGTWQASAGGGGDFSDGGEAGSADRTLGNTDNYDLGFMTNNVTRVHIQNDGKVGIGIASPAFALDVKDSLGINGTRVIYVPNQTDLTGSLIVGDGGSYLLHSAATTYGHRNTAVGISALKTTEYGQGNTAIGNESLYSNDWGNNNTANGYKALYTNIGGHNNTGLGLFALLDNTGSENVACGAHAIRQNTTGEYNTAIGNSALYTNTTGSKNTALGYGADVGSNNLENTTAIGYNASVNASNKIVIGDDNVTSIGGYADWTNYSDRRLKEAIEYRDDVGLDFIMKLNTASFNYKGDENKRRRDGLIAQDVEQALNELGIEFSGLIIDDDEQKTMNLSYGNFVLPLINAVKQQQKTIESLQARVEQLEK